ncbi:hypothetical protein QZH41_006292 [Actinostola sp. cb2023]|nr:hypothetical protein QZH41_006292 [Actinostola sp. cb2023]
MITNYLTKDNFDELDVFGLKIEKVKVVGRFKAADKVVLQKDGREKEQPRRADKDDEIISKYDKLTDLLNGKDDITITSTESKWTGKSSTSSQSLGENTTEGDNAIQDGGGVSFGSRKHKRLGNENENDTEITDMDSKVGFLSLHIWDNICEFSVESLKEFVLFPSLPKFRKLVNKSEVHGISDKNSGMRIFGFLHPNETGSYKFGISSDGNSEFWLSNDTNRFNARKIASVGSENEHLVTKLGKYDELSTQTTTHVNLTKGNKYFMEILYKHISGTGRVEVAWMKPKSSRFQAIPGPHLSTSDSHVTDNMAGANDYDGTSVYMSTKGLNYMPFMDFMDFEEAFSECVYQPSYYITKKLVRFQGARNKDNTHFAEIYPPDSSSETLSLIKDKDIWWKENNNGNDVIDATTVMHVGKFFADALETKYKKDFKVIELMSMERVVDKFKGNRYHIQMEIEDIYSGRHYEFSEFLYQPRGLGSLCFPRGFRWSKYADVNVIVPVKNSGRWALYLIKNLAEIIDKTRDPHVRVIIVDYESTDIDIEAVLKRSVITRYTVVRMPGNKTFNRAEALQKGADAVMDPHSILFMCDLHLTIPATFIGTIRKHCVEGKMAFAPVVKRLQCGFYPRKPMGYWETLGFGLFALYKSDFDRVGAMNVENFRDWGGEDWELLDRVLEARMEVERLKIPSFYHFFHPAYGNEQSRFNVK